MGIFSTRMSWVIYHRIFWQFVIFADIYRWWFSSQYVTGYYWSRRESSAAGWGRHSPAISMKIFFATILPHTYSRYWWHGPRRFIDIITSSQALAHAAPEQLPKMLFSLIFKRAFAWLLHKLPDTSKGFTTIDYTIRLSIRLKISAHMPLFYRHL